MNAFVLKIIALVTMIIDHTGAVLGGDINRWVGSDSSIYLRYIGRIAFPIYVYLIAEGARHTKDFTKYLLRLLMFAFISQLPFAMAFRGAELSTSYPFLIGFSFLSYTNVFYTLFLGAATLYFSRLVINPEETDKRRRYSAYALSLTIAVAIACSAEALGTDYGGVGVLLIYSVGISKKKYQKLTALFAGIILLYTPTLEAFNTLTFHLDFGSSFITAIREAVFYWTNNFKDWYWKQFVCALISIVLLGFYNGKRGAKIKWAFYAAYPVHLIALIIIAAFLGHSFIR